MKHFFLTIIFSASFFISVNAQVIKTLPGLGFSTFHELHDVAIGKDSTIWGAATSGILYYKKGEPNFYQLIDGKDIQNVSSVEVDSAGNVWFGSLTEGLLRYDGTAWKSFRKEDGSIPNNGIYALKIDRKGNVWASSEMGISKFNGKTWTTFNSKNGFVDPSLSPAASIAEDQQGTIYVSQAGKVYAYNGKTWSPLPDTGMEVNGLFVDNKNQLWILGNKVLTYKNGAYKEVPVAAKIKKETSFFRMVQEKDGTLWISSWLDGAVRIKGEEYKLFTQADGFMHAVITNMYIGKDGTVWFTTYNGLSYYSEKK